MQRLIVLLKERRVMFSYDQVKQHPKLLLAMTGLTGRTFQLGEGWHSSKNTVHFWNP